LTACRRDDRRRLAYHRHDHGHRACSALRCRHRCHRRHPDHLDADRRRPGLQDADHRRRPAAWRHPGVRRRHHHRDAGRHRRPVPGDRHPDRPAGGERDATACSSGWGADHLDADHRDGGPRHRREHRARLDGRDRGHQDERSRGRTRPADRDAGHPGLRLGRPDPDGLARPDADRAHLAGSSPYRSRSS
jgi:hypothetical protein